MSAPLVLKFGGASLATGDRIRRAVDRVVFHRRRGTQVLVVVSARGRSTDQTLRDLDRIVLGEPAGDGDAGRMIGEGARGPSKPAVVALGACRERDRALATCEDLSAALLAASLCAREVPARSLRGGEAGLRATGSFGSARPANLDPAPLETLLKAGVVPVVSGFQAVRDDGEVVTLGRGGSDLTAVLLAAELGATECQLVKDVPGIFDRDPARDPGAILRAALSHDEAVELASNGAAVLQLQAAEMARARTVPLRVLHYADPFGAAAGTLVGGGSGTDDGAGAAPVDPSGGTEAAAYRRLRDSRGKGSTCFSASTELGSWVGNLPGRPVSRR